MWFNATYAIFCKSLKTYLYTQYLRGSHYCAAEYHFGDISIAIVEKLLSSRRAQSTGSRRTSSREEELRWCFAVSYKWHEELGRDSHNLYERKSNQRETKGEKSSLHWESAIAARHIPALLNHSSMERSVRRFRIASIEITSSISRRGHDSV